MNRKRKIIRNHMRDLGLKEDEHWRIENGGKHDKIVVFGRLAGVIQKGGRESGETRGRAIAMNVIKSIDRIVAAHSAA